MGQIENRARLRAAQAAKAGKWFKKHPGTPIETVETVAEAVQIRKQFEPAVVETAETLPPVVVETVPELPVETAVPSLTSFIPEEVAAVVPAAPVVEEPKPAPVEKKPKERKVPTNRQPAEKKVEPVVPPAEVPAPEQKAE